MSGTEQAQAIEDGDISPVDAVEASLERIDDIDGKINAFATVVEEEALERAREIEAMMEHGTDPGPLAGVPVAVKDLIMTEGIRTTFGSTMYEEFVPDRDSIVVQRIRDAGGIIIGKTNCSEFGFRAVTDNDIFGTTRNPVDSTRTPGGSSGGSAAAVAANMVPFALGSDGGGSVRLPASFCGVFGLKGSFGRVPIYPEHRDPDMVGANGWGSVEHIGPITRTVEDGALLYEVMAGPHQMDRHSIPAEDVDYRHAVASPEIDDLKVAYSADLGHAAVDQEIRDRTFEAAQVFEEALGCDLTTAELSLPDYQDTFGTIVANTTDLKGLRESLYEYGATMDDEIIGLLEDEWTATDFTEAMKDRQRLNNQIREFMQEYDLLITPTTCVPPFPVGKNGPTEIEGRTVSPSHWQSFTFPINLTGHPAATVPAGTTAEGGPVGLQIVGSHLQDATVLAAAVAYQSATDW